MKNIVAIGIGAAIGTYLRYFLNIYLFSADYPTGTLIENLSGSLLLGVLSGYVAVKKPKEWVKVGLGVGLCGSFTTFSTFASDTVWLYIEFDLFQALFLYVIPTLFGGILLAMIGFLVGRTMGGFRA